MKRLLVLVIFFTLPVALMAQGGVYRNSYNWLEVKFNEPIVVSDLLQINNYTVSNSSAQNIPVLNVVYNTKNMIYFSQDSATTSCALKFEKLQWGMIYDIEVNNVRDTASNIINENFKQTFWSFETDKQLTTPTNIGIK